MALSSLQRITKHTGVIRYSPTQWDDPDHQIGVLSAGYDVLYDGGTPIRHLLNLGANRSPKDLANTAANHHKMVGKWGGNTFEILERTSDLVGRRRA